MNSQNNLKNNFIFNICMIFGAATIAPTALFAPLGTWIPLAICAIGAITSKQSKSLFIGLKDHTTLILIAIIFWTTLSTFWTSNINTSFLNTSGLLGVTLAGFLVFQTIKCSDLAQMFSKIMIVSFLFTSIFILVDVNFHLGIRPWLSHFFDPNQDTEWYGYRNAYYSRGKSAILILSFAVCCLLWKKSKKKAFMLLTVSIFCIVYDPIPKSIIAASIASIITFMLVLLFKRTPVIILSIFIPIFMIVSPLAISKYEKEVSSSLDGINLSITHRKEIWIWITKKISEKPIIGHGYNSSKNIADGKKWHVDIETRGMPSHPHNLTLQIWLELGLIGILLFSLLFISICVKILNLISTDPPKGALASGLLMTGFSLYHTSYGAWQVWWGAVIIFSIIIINSSLEKKKNS